MNYQHAFHAGNVADVFKHYVLVQILKSLKAKPTPFCALDSHAGSGLYALKAGGEHEHGIGKLWGERERWPALADYFAVLAKHNTGRLTRYPGSPLFIADAVREQDRAVLLELHDKEYRNLKALFPRGQGIGVQHADAWKTLKGLVPPRENRGLVLIDPPYEKSDELEQILGFLGYGLKHWRNGVYAIWYPIKAYAPVLKFHQKVARLGGGEAFAVDFITLPLDVSMRLNGSGLLLINPPWGLADTLAQTLPPLAGRLAGDGGQPRVELHQLKGVTPGV